LAAAKLAAAKARRHSTVEAIRTKLFVDFMAVLLMIFLLK
jgi:hypothetical protein